MARIKRARSPIAISVLVVALCWTGVVSGGDPASAPPQQGVSPEELDDEALEALLALHHTEDETVRMVLLPASVTTRKGRPVKNLRIDDFVLFEDAIPQDIRYFSAVASEPLHIAFLLDVSGSMRQSDKLVAAKEAIRYFLDTLRPDDRFALIGFADDQVSWITDFTSDRKRFMERLVVQEGFGQTALNDAAAATPRLVDEKILGRKAIVLLTDGIDNASRMSDWEAMTTARKVNVPIYAIGFTNLPDHVRLSGTTDPSLRLPAMFARETGGQMFQVDDPIDLKEAAVTIAEELRFQYLLGYYPSHGDWDGRFRRIRLETASGRPVRTRNGYYAHP